METKETKEKFILEALREAKKAAQKGEVPVGCVIVRAGVILARAHNQKIRLQNPTAHAEILAIQKAAKKTGVYLNGCDLYISLEPCPMCAGAMINARIDNVYFGAYDPKAGCAGTLYNLPADPRFNHRANVEGGILEEQCGKILSDFFKQKRTEK
jgi:tRNA(adenine34) deaminase